MRKNLVGTVTLSVEEISEAIADWVLKNTGKKMTSFRPTISHQYDQFDRGTGVAYLKEIVAEIDFGADGWEPQRG